jgi:hypothetical protein
VYFAQPAGRPSLSVGKHTVVANFRASAGSNLVSSQSRSNLTITVTGFTITATSGIVDDPASVNTPTLTLGLDAPEFVKSFGGTPAGEWSVSVKSDAGAVVFEKTLAQPTTTEDPISVPIAPRLKAGHNFTVTTVFTPDASIAGGVTVKAAAPIDYTTPAASPFESLVNPIDFPLWAQLTFGALLVALIAAVIVLAVRLRTVQSGVRRESELPNDTGGLG